MRAVAMVVCAARNIAMALDRGAIASEGVKRWDRTPTKVLVGRPHTGVHDIDVRILPGERGPTTTDTIEVPKVLLHGGLPLSLCKTIWNIHFQARLGETHLVPKCL